MLILIPSRLTEVLPYLIHGSDCHEIAYFEIVKELLRRVGADPTLKDSQVFIALLYSSEHGYVEIVKELLKTIADIHTYGFGAAKLPFALCDTK